MPPRSRRSPARSQRVKPTERFFDTPQAASALKHGILHSYLTPFASKTGSFSRDGRVVIVDGYAGEGRYKDGSPGSPVQFLEAARNCRDRDVVCFFIESNRAKYKRLVEVLSAEAQNVSTLHREGRFLKYVDEVLSVAGGLPLLVFLDPFGRGIPFNDLVRVLNRYGYQTFATEVILNFSTVSVWRAVGRLSEDSEAARKHLSNMDAALGDSWWRALAQRGLDSDLRPGQIAQQIAAEYMNRVCAATGYGGWTIEAQRAQNTQPIYHIQFYSRHPDGMLIFGQAASKGLERWRAVERQNRFEKELGGSLLEGMQEDMAKAEEESVNNELTAAVRRNVVSLLRDRPSFDPRKYYDEVFSNVEGIARGTHLTRACRGLFHDGIVTKCSRLLSGGSISRGPSWPPADEA